MNAEVERDIQAKVLELRAGRGRPVEEPELEDVSPFITAADWAVREGRRRGTAKHRLGGVLLMQCSVLTSYSLLGLWQLGEA